jgi:putative addiction module component (TIGR02574 family)
MGKAEIIDALSQLSLAERSEVLARLVQLEAAEDQGPSAAERDLLDSELEDYRASPAPGSPWESVEARLRRRQ